MSWIQDPAVQENMQLYSKTVVHSTDYVTAAGTPKAYTSPELMKAANTLRTQDQFFITESTNGGVVVLWNRSEYEIEALRQLSDRENYHLEAIE